MPPTAAFVYGIAQFLADSVNANCRHWQLIFLLEDIRKDAVSKRSVRLICIQFVVRSKASCVNANIFHTNSDNGIEEPQHPFFLIHFEY